MPLFYIIRITFLKSKETKAHHEYRINCKELVILLLVILFSNYRLF